jgi:uncharacterized protein YbjT (DUF2867 family)
LIDIEDVADVATTVLLEPGRHAGRTHELTGPRALTYAEAVELIARATDRPVTYQQVSPGEHTAALVGRGVDEASARAITAMYGLIGRGVLAEPTDGVAAVTGRAPRPVEDYVLRTAVAGVWTR